MIESFVPALQKDLSKLLSYRKLVELSSKFNFPLAPPLIATVDVTSRCNSKCSYCDIWKMKDVFQDVPLDKLDGVFSSITKLGVRFVSLSGGEPLIRNDLEEVISLAKHYDLMVHVDTNGILLTMERALKLKEAGLSSIALSLDSLDPEIYENLRGVSFKFAEQALASLLYISDRYPDLWAAVNCVITRHNIGTLVPFVNWISEYGEGRISVILQPYHRPSSFAGIEVSQLSPKLREIANELLASYQGKPSQDDLIPGPELLPVFENEVQELIQLKKLKPGLLTISESYLKTMPDFLFDGKMPKGFNCVAGYIGIYIGRFVQSNLEVYPCWRLPPVGNLEKEELSDIWFSQRFRKRRVDMKYLKCPGCMFLCHGRDPSWDGWYNMIYKPYRSKDDRIR